MQAGYPRQGRPVSRSIRQHQELSVHVIKLFRHHVSVGSVVMVCSRPIRCCCLPSCRWRNDSRRGAPGVRGAPSCLVFAALMLGLNGSLGLYRREGAAGFGGHLARVLLAVAIGMPVVYMLSR